MIKADFDSRLNLLEKQKRRLSLLVVLEAGLITLLALILLVMAGKRERIVVVPAEFTEEFWVETNKVSSSYIRQVGDYFVKLAMTATPDTAESQYAFILKNVYPPYYGKLKSDFIQKIDKIKKKSITTVFNAREYAVDVHDLSVVITGDFQLSTGRQKLDSEEKRYKIGFIYDNGRLYVKEILEV